MEIFDVVLNMCLRKPTTAAVLSTAFLGIVPYHAQGQMVPYFDPRTGYTTYSNVRPTGYPAPIAARPDAQTATAGVLRASDKPFPEKRTKTTSPESFPKVSSSEQRSRDQDRRAILTDELQFEMAALQDKTAASDQSAVARHQKNIESLKREIAKLQ